MTDHHEDPQYDQLEASKTVEALVTDLVGDLVAALINARIYWTDHPRVLTSIREVVRRLKEICAARATDSITLAVTQDFLVFEDRPLLGASLSASRLIKALREWSSGGIRMMRGASVEDYELLLRSIHAPRGEGDDFQRINEKLVARGETQQLEMLPMYKDLDGSGGGFDSQRGQLSVPMHLYQSVMDLLQGITVSVSTGGKIDFAHVQGHAEVMLQRLENNEGPLINLARQDQYDAFTFGHSVRVSVLALNFGRALTDDTGALIRLGTAALLHDVGKAMVPFEVLHSTKKLSAEERDEICRHPEYGAQILLDHEDSDPHAIAATFGHHCSYASRGYPKTLHEHQISMVTDIVGIVDVFEALTAARPYKKPMSPIRAYRIMMGLKDKFDPRLLRRFIEVNGVYPCGQLVHLSTGEHARVLSQTQGLCLPEVQVISDRDDNILTEDDQWTLDLSHQETSNPVTIVHQLQKDVATLV